MFLEKIRLCKNLKEVNDCICKIFQYSPISNYMPALISEGHYSLDGGEDFYAKLVAIPLNARIDHTWLRMNLANSDIARSIDKDGKDLSLYSHNIVVEYHYLSNKLYSYNNALNTIDEIYFGKQEDSKVACQYYNSIDYTIKPMCLKYIDENYYVFKDLIYKITDGNYADAMQICIDFEYRNKELSAFEEIGKIQNDLGYFDIASSKEHGLSIIGSIYFPLKRQKKEKQNDEIKVIRILDNNEMDSLDKTNYNDDTKIGIVLFNIEALNILKKYYTLYDFSLISNFNNQDVMIDIMEDKIGFFEGEFNKFPEDIVDEIKQYNIQEFPKDGIIVSQAMFDWQLQGSWQFIDKALPFQKLGNLITLKHIEKARDLHLSLFPPTTKEELLHTYQKIIRVLNLLDQTAEVETFVDLLLKEGSSVFYIYQSICLSIFKRVDIKNDER